MILNQEWYNLNSNRRYPFKSSASLLDITKRNYLSNDFIVDAIFVVSKNWQEDFYLSKYLYDSTRLILEVSCRVTEEVALAGSPTGLIGINSYVGSTGKIIVQNTYNLIEGEWSFSDTEFEPCRILKLHRGITSINGIYDGPITIEAGQNAIVTTENNKIEVKASSDPCNCKDNGCKCIQTINGVEPINSNIQISGIGCVTVSETENGIEIGNQCEESCCGCDEVNDMIDRIKDLEERVIRLESM